MISDTTHKKRNKLQDLSSWFLDCSIGEEYFRNEKKKHV